MSGSSPQRVAICVPSSGRTGALLRLLRSVRDLYSVEGVEVIVIIVDNSRDARLIPIEDRLRDAAHRSLVLVREPKQGVATARNTAVRIALDHADVIAFVDDDQTVHPRWLGALLDASARYHADIVAGPVVSILPREMDHEHILATFFDRPRLQSGKELAVCGAGNVLIDRCVFEDHDWFDSAFDLAGGEDTEFFGRVSRAGASIVWCDEAVAYEHVERSRIRRAWLARRYLRAGNTLGLLMRREPPGAIVRAGARALRRLFRGLFHSARSSLSGDRISAWRALFGSLEQVGFLIGMSGFRYTPFRRRLGRS